MITRTHFLSDKLVAVLTVKPDMFAEMLNTSGPFTGWTQLVSPLYIENEGYSGKRWFIDNDTGSIAKVHFDQSHLAEGGFMLYVTLEQETESLQWFETMAGFTSDNGGMNIVQLQADNTYFTLSFMDITAGGMILSLSVPQWGIEPNIIALNLTNPNGGEYTAMYGAVQLSLTVNADEAILQMRPDEFASFMPVAHWYFEQMNDMLSGTQEIKDYDDVVLGTVRLYAPEEIAPLLLRKDVPSDANDLLSWISSRTDLISEDITAGVNELTSAISLDRVKSIPALTYQLRYLVINTLEASAKIDYAERDEIMIFQENDINFVGRAQGKKKALADVKLPKADVTISDLGNFTHIVVDGEKPEYASGIEIGYWPSTMAVEDMTEENQEWGGFADKLPYKDRPGPWAIANGPAAFQVRCRWVITKVKPTWEIVKAGPWSDPEPFGFNNV